MYPPLFLPLPTSQEMRLWDETATHSFSIPPLVLMENASRGALRVLLSQTPLTPQTQVLIIMGGGNNGGDGAALARHLQDMGCQVLVYYLAPLAKMSETARAHIKMAERVGVNFLPLGTAEELCLPLEWRNPDIIIDAICGIGMKGDLRTREQACVRAINAHKKQSLIIALDVPTGLCADRGIPLPEAVEAHITIAFEAAQPGLYVPGARPYAGKVIVCPIGMPRAVQHLVPASWRLLAPAPGDWATPSPLLHKGKAGKVLIVGGSERMAGAPLLAALGSLRAGAGTVHIACPGGIEPTVRQGWPEVQTCAVGATGQWEAACVPELMACVERIAPSAIVIGPGMGRSAGAKAIVQAALALRERCPVLVDADALWFLPQRQEPVPGSPKQKAPPLMALLREQDIITPHAGEMACLLPPSFFGVKGRSPRVSSEQRQTRIKKTQDDRPASLRALTDICAAVVVFKGPGTLIGQRNAPITLSPRALAALAVGGSGDVLSGIVAGLLSGGMLPLDATCLGVYLHCRAGEILAQTAPRGHLAQEIAHAVPRALAELLPSPVTPPDR